MEEATHGAGEDDDEKNQKAPDPSRPQQDPLARSRGTDNGSLLSDGPQTAPGPGQELEAGEG